MIEVTNEMLGAFQAAAQAAVQDYDFCTKDDAAIQLEAGLAAVLAAIERDYRITCPARYELERGTTHCVKAPGHPGGHRGEHPSAGVFWL